MSSHSAEPLLSIEALDVTVDALQRRVIDKLDLHVARGETVALVGESGSGKSLTARAIMQLLPSGIRVTQGRIRCGADDLTALSPRAMNAIRGRRIAMLFQQPQLMLDPTCRAGDQVGEAMRKHLGLSRAAAAARTLDLLRDVGIPDPERRARAFAFELSGGLAQRVMLAAALSADPELLIADEPTTALDVTVQAQILRLIDDQRRKRQMAVLLISHDLAMVSAVASRVAVMYAGRIVETGSTAAVLAAPRHPYTRALVACSLLDAAPQGALTVIRGSISSALRVAGGCRFLPRCDVAEAEQIVGTCTEREPDLRPNEQGGSCRCWADGATNLGSGRSQ